MGIAVVVQGGVVGRWGVAFERVPFFFSYFGLFFLHCV